VPPGGKPAACAPFTMLMTGLDDTAAVAVHGVAELSGAQTPPGTFAMALFRTVAGGEAENVAVIA
jgi:hypothetical protein